MIDGYKYGVNLSINYDVCRNYRVGVEKYSLLVFLGLVVWIFFFGLYNGFIILGVVIEWGFLGRVGEMFF